MPSVTLLVIACAVTIVAAAVQGVIGFGLAVVSVPVLALMHPALAPVPQTLVSVPMVLALAWRERHAIDWHGIGWVIAGRIPGALLGLALITLLDAESLAVAMAVIVFAAVVIVWRGYSIPRNRMSSFLAGMASGTGALVASIGGPPLALLYRSTDGATLRSSVSTVFALGVAITLATRGFSGNISHQEVAVAAILLPAAALGLVIGTRIAPRLEGPAVRAGVLLLSSLAAIGLVVKTVVG
jgi:uncharacterized membrane protein YfcA